MKKREIDKAAKGIVLGMLKGRCVPEDSDVDHISDDPETIEKLKEAVQKVLDRLAGQLVEKFSA